MTTTTGHKRLDELESSLTPKEWAIRLVSEMRKHPTALAFTKALAKLPLHELPVRRPYFAFEAQASERHPGRKPEDIRSRHQLTDALWKEFHTLKLLIAQVDQAMERKVETLGLQAALGLAALHSLILQDAFAQTAAQATALLMKQKPRDEKAERQTTLKLLAAFTEGNIRKMRCDQLIPKDAISQYPEPLTEWHHELIALLKDFFAHGAAVELVQSQHFDGHPILFLNLEGELVELARTIESAVATANEYLKCCAVSVAGDKSGLVIDLESIKVSSSGTRAVAIAAKWLRDARFEVLESDAEQWEQWRAEFGISGRPADHYPRTPFSGIKPE